MLPCIFTVLTIKKMEDVFNKKTVLKLITKTCILGTMKNNPPVLLSLLLVLISLMWAGSFIVVDYITSNNGIDPFDLGFLRFLVATPVMILILLIQRKSFSLPRRELPFLIVLGLTGVTLLYLFQYLGVLFTNASTSAVLINTNVIFIAVLSAGVLHESFSTKKVGGIVLSFIGVVIVISSNIQKEAFAVDNIFFIGSLSILLSALCWAIYTIVGKRLLKQYDNYLITTYAFILGTVFYLPLVISDIVPAVQQISIDGWMIILYLALGCSVFGYVGWYYALKRIEASKAAVFLNFIPLFAIVMSFIIGAELTIFFLLGAMLIIYGVYVTQRS